ncbi:MAG: GTP-binding protein [Pirellulales bacterium]|nr:GTP-binding protein [Pirellulales bacterium]
MSHVSTFVVELTPPGRGAIAVVCVAGPDALAAVDSGFFAVNRKPLAQQPIGRIVFGRWKTSDHHPGEELVVCRCGEDRVEVHPHGGIASVQAVVDWLVHFGCTRLDWKTWLPREEPDPIRAAARTALAYAPTQRTAFILLDQYQGALRRAMDALESTLQSAGPAEPFRSQCDALLARVELGRHLIRPWHVVLAGKPNVGKSCLANAILGFERALVDTGPGTTRDVVTATTAIDGWPVELSDTAGLRDSPDALERAGIALAEHQLLAADLIVWIEDPTMCESGRTPGDLRSEALSEGVPAGSSMIFAINKIDLLNSQQRSDLRPFLDDRVLAISAKTGEGVDCLLDAISSRLVPNPPQPGAAVPFTEEQVEKLQEMK